jgi:hypothetical protein
MTWDRVRRPKVPAAAKADQLNWEDSATCVYGNRSRKAGLLTSLQNTGILGWSRSKVVLCCVGGVGLGIAERGWLSEAEQDREGRQLTTSLS